jgi:hypothetical protein
VLAGSLARRSALGSIPDNTQEEKKREIMRPRRFKRTTPFDERCQFVWSEADLIVRCEHQSAFALYFGNDETVNAVSLCLYHLVNQENLWIGGNT